MNKQQLAAKIWASANKMRSKIEANEYKDYILGFIFYKFLSDKELEVLRKDGWTEDELPELTEADKETVKYLQGKLGYFIAYENLFSTWLSSGSDFDVSNVRDALSAFARLINKNHKKVFNKIFHTLDTGLSKLGGTSSEQTKAILKLLKLIKDIPTDSSQDYDVLGFIYEYLISNFAANAGKKAGEFYTPHEVALLMAEIVADHLKDRKEIQIYDPTSGSGSLLINIGRAIAKHIFDLLQGAFFVVIVQERKLRRKNGIHDIHFAVMFNFHIRFREHARRKMRRGRDGSLHRVGVDAHGVALIFKGGLQTVLRNPLAEIGTHFFFEEFPVRREALGLYGPGVPLMRRKLTDG